jgi:hypothetical protein
VSIKAPTLQGQRPNAKIWGGDEYHTALNVCPPKITVPLVGFSIGYRIQTVAVAPLSSSPTLDGDDFEGRRLPVFANSPDSQLD